MPSLKRSSEFSDSKLQSDGDSEIPASSDPASHSRKRARSSALLTLDAPGTSPAGSPSPTRSPSRDDGLPEDEEDEADLELRQTQIIQEKYAQQIDEANVPAEHGILERVECFNFMCHNHFSVELGPLINFIVGKNGSGKSAILTAITLCLGGKASATNRGQSLKSFIKEGKENASIIVRIKNQGDGAYMPDDYGKSIIVERHFTKSGSSGFKIKNEQGRIVSTRKAELDAITDYFSLQIDNPMNVLSQDMARQFLSSSSAAEKYRFFVKGVQLEQLDQDYRLIEECVDQTEEKLRSQAPNLQLLENQRNLARKKLELSDQQDTLRERIRNYRNQMVWAEVEDHERIRDSLTNEIVKADDVIALAEAELVRFDDALQAVDVELETATELLNRALRSVEDRQRDREVVIEETKALTGETNNVLAEERAMKIAVDGAESALKDAERKIEEEEHRLTEVSNGGYARKQEECEQAQAQAAAARDEYQSRERGHTSLHQAISSAEAKVRAADSQIKAKQMDFHQAKTRLQELKRDNARVRDGFPDKLPSLLRAIEQERSFGARPIGPVGKYITLLKPKWASIIENTLGTSLNSFVVENHRDQKILSNVMKRVGCHCPILVGTNKNIDTSNYEPDSQYDTIENDSIRGHLIVRHTIEKMLLVEKLEDATSLMFNGERLKNVARCFSIDSRDQRRGIHLSYNREGGPSQSPVAAYKGYPRMKSDAASQTRHQEQVVQQLKQELDILQKEYDAAEAHLQTCRRNQANHRQEIGRLMLKLQQLEDHAESLRDALENSADGQLDALISIRDKAQADLQHHQSMFAEGRRVKTEKMNQLKLKRREEKEIEDHLRQLQNNLRIARQEQKKVDDKRHQIISSKNLALSHIEDYKRSRDRIRDKRDQVEARLLQDIEKASMVTPRVAIDEGETLSSLDKKLDKLKADLERHSNRLGATREEIAIQASAAEAKYQRALKQVEEATALAQIFKDTLTNRKKRWEIFRSHISSRAKAQFTYLLSERSFRGRLLTNHQEKLLDLQVEPDITKDNDEGRGAKTLSGGEKSFSQICLLLALWEAMGSPIRCLDEFDVYMDHINRRMAIDMLMIAARRSIGRQFILITPGTKTDITLAPDVRVKELAEPERGQTTLPFSR
ncbi:hypothetical protein N7539_009067 [Penicillium diatomitis]|uniref:Rad50/SbcC-type AAA domain-containing protein n=1 Tax=Penicillium diatomitis TaxID=2819901 RepID=A0A9X0BJG7_9EURO|nr:uncharacterized protein N7539_009067 [Penicillium diatomitis]KAJ5469449.1 hypothetical protein N7539_009067 [Penicillium diatomitis]